MSRRKLLKTMQTKASVRASLAINPVSEEVSARIRERLLAYPPFRGASDIFIYISLPTEPDTFVLIETLLRAGKRVSVPKCGPRPFMTSRIITGFDNLNPGFMNIPEPPESAPAMTVPDLAVIPCLACDRSFTRLGHGAGYYDAYLARVKCPSVCLCPSGLLLDSLPCDELDVKPDAIITENETLLRA